jgi:hypothetical protein
MNLPAYRRALHMAHERFQQEVQEAADRLAKAVIVADSEFHEDQDEIAAADPKRRKEDY